MTAPDNQPPKVEQLNTLETALVIVGTTDVFANAYSVGFESPELQVLGIASGIAIAGLGVYLNKRRETSAQNQTDSSQNA